ncbi:MAG: hypothetical protein FVQ77_12515 [Cytophagales bacterium]|nr:hypothetical protein [Cytophagales bacterium]
MKKFTLFIIIAALISGCNFFSKEDETIGDIGMSLEITEEEYLEALAECGDVKVENLVFRVQIGAYIYPPDPYEFDFLQGVGDIEMVEDDDGYSKFLVNKVETLNQVESLKQNIRAQGVKDAFVAPYFYGKRIKVRKAVEFICKDAKGWSEL